MLRLRHRLQRDRCRKGARGRLLAPKCHMSSVGAARCGRPEEGAGPAGISHPGRPHRAAPTKYSLILMGRVLVTHDRLQQPELLGPPGVSTGSSGRSRSASSRSARKGEGRVSAVSPREVRLRLWKRKSREQARVMPTKKSRRSSAASAASPGSGGKENGSRPSSQPTRKTTGNSSPFEACRVSSDTPSARGSQASTSPPRAISARKPSRSVPGADGQRPEQIGRGEEGRGAAARRLRRSAPRPRGRGGPRPAPPRRSRARSARDQRLHPGCSASGRWERFWNGMPARPSASISGGVCASVR